ncbi:MULTISPECIES: potassium-transporting ATPase subunit KdpB [Geobacillus]|uniref:Potassium-transporting ATPase ATP-binding subunit n=4 Tax=Geobacillus TaxID=129337 RepID=Q5KUV4_GEOKA|nr:MULTISPECIES: potassium-transporting ATPase subunit KdpB [Geobacillus]AKU26520.1 potassium-transporting ATPase subunit B [Geobacillus sp. LC300]ASS87189.1 potassium-transporting ATPase subunit B [Geobacillus lituanicus]MED4876824.1 potassium-transporting ATPase subunit KdpB [Anoxybacillus geothermalis]ASS98046.1 potassium-transporting ATPase subunit B [Geobacillus thermocatenulatus]AWO74609.1 K(+)-transporting ATPase subunit B [Geobacillus thermoleovorans]
MRGNDNRQSLFQPELVRQAAIESVKKLNPLVMMRNPVMFVVEIGTLIVLLMLLFPRFFRIEDWKYELAVFVILLLTILFANFAEALAEGRGKAQAESLKKTKADTIAKRISAKGEIELVASTQLRKGDIVLVEAGDLIPGDGEIIEGLASIDESAITGESAPVIKEAGGDFSSVTGGTKVVSDWIKVKITADPGESFLDKMISLVEGATRQKTPNELALNILLVTLTLIFLIVVVTLVPIARYVGIHLSITTLIILLVCLIPTTIGGLLSAIGIAGMNRLTQFNVLAMSGKAVEAAGDVTTIVLDKTGTITFGNRMAAQFIPVGGTTEEQVREAAVLSSIKDETPEGRSVLELAKQQGWKADVAEYEHEEFVPFTAETRMSGMNVQGIPYRKGAVDAISRHVKQLGGRIPSDLKEKSEQIAKQGGTPLAVSVGADIVGIIYLKDTVKPGMRQRFDELRKMGIKTIMCTGDNPLTAATIANEAGVDEFIAESKPEDKIRVIREEQAKGNLVAMTGDGTNDAPALAQADVGLAMNSGTMAAKEAANMIDLDSDPTKIIEVISIGKQLLMTRGALTTFSIANDIAKYFAILPAVFVASIPQMKSIDILHLHSPASAILSALIFNAVIIPLLIPLAMRGVRYQPMSSEKLLRRNMLIYGGGGVIAPFIGIKVIDLALGLFM